MGPPRQHRRAPLLPPQITPRLSRRDRRRSAITPRNDPRSPSILASIKGHPPLSILHPLPPHRSHQAAQSLPRSPPELRRRRGRLWRTQDALPLPFLLFSIPVILRTFLTCLCILLTLSSTRASSVGTTVRRYISDEQSKEQKATPESTISPSCPPRRPADRKSVV